MMVGDKKKKRKNRNRFWKMEVKLIYLYQKQW